MIYSPRGRFRPLRLLTLVLFFSSSFFFLSRLLPALHFRAFQLYAHPAFDLAAYARASGSDTKLSVNLIVASLAKDDVSWTSKIPHLVPNLRILRYVADSSTAQYRPAVLKKGREALVYFTYIRDYYDDLPDVSIFTHSDENPWHVDAALRQSLPFALVQLDLDQVKRRGYFNLRPSWGGACPAWINTTKTVEEGHVKEEGYVGAAFRDNFGKDVAVPEILAGPCCSQFAVSRDTIRKVPKQQYQHHIDWLIKMSDVWGDSLTGRTWEHMWPYLFMAEAKDCPVERDSFCRMYHICFKDAVALRDYQKLWNEREGLKEKQESLHAFISDVTGSREVVDRKHRMAEIHVELEERLKDALIRGKDSTIREQTTRNLQW